MNWNAKILGELPKKETIEKISLEFKPLSGEGMGKWIPIRQKPYRNTSKKMTAPIPALSLLTPENSKIEFNVLKPLMPSTTRERKHKHATPSTLFSEKEKLGKSQ